MSKSSGNSSNEGSGKSQLKSQDKSGRSRLGFETLAIREGIERSSFGEHSEPIFATSSFVFDSAKEAAARFAGDEEGYIYSRFSNPSVDSFERRLAALEGGVACVATASGMSAILATVMTLLQQGDHIVASRSLFGSTVTLFEKVLPRFGISTSFVKIEDLQEWQDAITPATKMLFLETPTNPLTQLADIEQLAGLADSHDLLLAVDNCFCTPALQRPLEMGAHIVTHSATKYLDGQGRFVGGAIVVNEQVHQDDLIGFMRSAGPSLSPFNAWAFNKGLETLRLRMRQHSDNAATLAAWLGEHKSVKKVFYPGLQHHPQHDLAKRQQQSFGGIVSFELADKATAWGAIDNTQILSITANLGDAKTTITHPASTTHGRISAQARADAGIADGLIRVAVGLECVDDIIADLDQAIDRSVA